MKLEFFFQDDVSNKYWTIEIVGTSCTTTNGRFGAKPRETHKEFSTTEGAEKFFKQQIIVKLQAGYREGTAPLYVKPDWGSMRMSEEIFWRLISLFRWQKTGDDEAVVEPAIAALAEMSADDINQFDEILAEKLYALDTLEHASHIGDDSYKQNQYFSVDGFLYVRCCAVANGKEFYEAVRSEPHKMPKDMDFEPVLYIASNAHERKTKTDYTFSSSVSYETYSNADGWPKG